VDVRVVEGVPVEHDIHRTSTKIRPKKLFIWTASVKDILAKVTWTKAALAAAVR